MICSQPAELTEKWFFLEVRKALRKNHIDNRLAGTKHYSDSDRLLLLPSEYNFLCILVSDIETRVLVFKMLVGPPLDRRLTCWTAV